MRDLTASTPSPDALLRAWRARIAQALLIVMAAVVITLLAAFWVTLAPMTLAFGLLLVALISGVALWRSAPLGARTFAILAPFAYSGTISALSGQDSGACALYFMAGATLSVMLANVRVGICFILLGTTSLGLEAWALASGVSILPPSADLSQAAIIAGNAALFCSLATLTLISLSFLMDRLRRTLSQYAAALHDVASESAQRADALSQLQRAHADLQQTQAKLVHAGKVELLGQLASSVAHDMPHGGTFSISLTTSPAAALLAISDTGHGMDADTLTRAFDPFFTTKPQGVGTGLGLASARAIVQALGGDITCDSAPGQGARFLISLPLIDPARVPSPTTNPSTPLTPLAPPPCPVYIGPRPLRTLPMGSPMHPSPPTRQPTPTTPRRLAVLIACAIAAATPAPAQASIFDVFGMTARGTAMGGAQGAAGLDHAAVYYNPALLTLRKKVHFGVTLQGIVPNLSIDTAPDSSRQPVLPSSHMGVTIGAVFPLGGKIDDRIALGLAVYLPTLQSTRLDSPDPATPQTYLYQALPQALVLAAGLSGQVTDWLSIGLGVQMLANFNGAMEVDLSLERRRVERRTLKGDLTGEVAPTVGLLVGPFEGFSVGLTYRDDFGLGFSLPIRFSIDRVGVLGIDPKGTGLYTPDQWNLGFSYKLPTLPLLLAADLTWMRWSAAPGPAVSIVALLDDRGIRPNAEPPGVLLDLPTVDVPLGAQDTLVTHLGAEYRAAPWLAVQGGYVLRPTPIPDQRGYTSYADGTAHVVSAGASFTWADPLEVHDNPVSLDVFLQATLHPERRADKDPTRDAAAVGSWAFSGTIWNLGMELRHDF
jgi:long-chain fatty acid transport protein